MSRRQSTTTCTTFQHVHLVTNNACTRLPTSPVARHLLPTNTSSFQCSQLQPFFQKKIIGRLKRILFYCQNYYYYCYDTRRNLTYHTYIYCIKKHQDFHDKYSIHYLKGRENRNCSKKPNATKDKIIFYRKILAELLKILKLVVEVVVGGDGGSSVVVGSWLGKLGVKVGKYFFLVSVVEKYLRCLTIHIFILVLLTIALSIHTIHMYICIYSLNISKNLHPKKVYFSDIISGYLPL